MAANRAAPRTRGDGPEQFRDNLLWLRAPPHTRGWTEESRGETEAEAGSPAHAGMDRSRSGRARGRSGLPHTRGWTLGVPVLGLSVVGSPHTRGWTVDQLPADANVHGSPAHAGMDLGVFVCPHGDHGLPRTRGDGPRWGRRAPPMECGSPAHAGMDPRRAGSRRATWRLPRTRGDGPKRNAHAWKPVEAPPHTRGWTRAGRRAVRLDSGSPAHAGMDPTRIPRNTIRRGLPRTRGDGPIFV